MVYLGIIVAARKALTIKTISILIGILKPAKRMMPKIIHGA